MSQTSYSIDQAAAYDGSVYDLGSTDVVTAVVESSVIPGIFVTKGAASKGVTPPDALGEVTNPALARGFVVRDVSQESNASGELVYASEALVPVLKKGRIWVVCEDAFDESDRVYVRYATTTNGTQLGRVRTDIDATNAVLLERARFLNSGDAGALALLDLDLL